MTKVNSPREKVRALQRALYVAAKRNGMRKFPALFDRIALPHVLRRAQLGYSTTFGYVLRNVGFIQLAAGGALSGLVGGILMYLLLRPPGTIRSE